MEDLYRHDPPLPMEGLADSEVPFNLAVESLFYYQVHVRPSKWNVMILAMQKWWNIVRLLKKEDLTHKGYDYPDWRQFALLDLSMPTREQLRTKLRWFKGIDWLDMSNLVEQNQYILDENDTLYVLASIRQGLDKDPPKDTLYLYLISLLHCKYRIIASSTEEHDSLLPIYNSLYSLLLVIFELHPIIFKYNSFWRVHSILFLFPREIGLLDIHTFRDRTSWLINNMGILSKGLDFNDH